MSQVNITKASQLKKGSFLRIVKQI